MDTRWAEELDRSFGDGPPPPPATVHLAAGRVALRRRRLATGAASVAVVALVGGGLGWAAMPGDARAGAGQVATDPSPSAEAPPSPSSTLAPVARRPEDVRAATPAEVEDSGSDAMMPVTALSDGQLVRKADWEVQAIYVLLDKGDRRRSWGISAVPVGGGQAIWMILTWRPGTVGAVSDSAGKRFAVFEDWMEQTWAEQQGLDEPTVATMVDGDVVAAAGVTVLAVVMHPEEAAAYGPVEDQAAVRLLLSDGTVVFARVDPMGATTVDPAVLAAPTMAAFLRHLGAQGDNGEGLR